MMAIIEYIACALFGKSIDIFFTTNKNCAQMQLTRIETEKIVNDVLRNIRQFSKFCGVGYTEMKKKPTYLF